MAGWFNSLFRPRARRDIFPFRVNGRQYRDPVVIRRKPGDAEVFPRTPGLNLSGV